MYQTDNAIIENTVTTMKKIVAHVYGGLYQWNEINGLRYIDPRQ